jgi:hypothetical protein
MKYEEYYYKNLCEKYQKRIDILERYLSEAGLKKALKTGKPELLAKEGIKQGERRERLLSTATEMGQRASDSARKYGPMSKQVGAAGLQQQAALSSAQQIGQNIEDIDIQLASEDPELRKRSSGMYMRQSMLGPDVFPERPMQDYPHVGSAQY